MDRAMTVEERIRKAEEIYANRKKRENHSIIQEKDKEVKYRKKDMKLLRKIIIQLIVCVTIYFIFYMIQNNEYILSKEVLNRSKEILEYDINFIDAFQDFKNNIMAFINNYINKENNNYQSQEAIGGAEDKINEDKMSQEENKKINVQEEEKKDEDNKETQQILSQEEQDIQNIKNTTTFIKPINGKITSSFGRRESATGRVPKNHTGTDIAANIGTKIKSATDGEVVISSEEGDYGKHLKIQIGEVSVIYAHCNSLYVKQGDKVIQGQEIAEVGSTGNSTGPHLHFEIRIAERVVNPENILEL